MPRDRTTPLVNVTRLWPNTRRCWRVQTFTTHTMKPSVVYARPIRNRTRGRLQGQALKQITYSCRQRGTMNTHQQTRARRLLLCLDGVPHRLIEQAKSRGLFDTFGSPTRLLSPFPTMTNVALSAMLGASPPAGYESLYFDRKAGELRGGIRKYVGRRTPDKVPSSYMDELDYQEPLMFEFLIYVAPEKVWRTDMQRFREKFRAAPQNRDYFAFLKATDGLLHAQGPDRLAVALESLDKILKEIRSYCGEETEIMMFSDHGMNLEENHRTALASTLQRKGYDVVIPAFGLCSYAAAYCRNGDQ